MFKDDDYFTTLTSVAKYFENDLYKIQVKIVYTDVA